jgi:hypothetical protein
VDANTGDARTGTLTVAGKTFTISQDGASSQSDPDYTGWWGESGKGGTGISIENQGDILFMAWYAYKGVQPWWYVAVCTKTGDGVYQGDMLEYSGWELGTTSAPATQSSVGSVTFTFQSEDQASMEWSIGSASNYKGGTKTLTRWMPGYAPGDADPHGITGWWGDPDYDNIGWFMESHGDTLFLAWFHYGVDGEPRWWTLGADVGGFPASATSYTGPFVQWSGGQEFGGDYKEATGLPIGTTSLSFSGLGTDQARATFTWGTETFTLKRYDFTTWQ